MKQEYYYEIINAFKSEINTQCEQIAHIIDSDFLNRKMTKVDKTLIKKIANRIKKLREAMNIVKSIK